MDDGVAEFKMFLFLPAESAVCGPWMLAVRALYRALLECADNLYRAQDVHTFIRVRED